uniref:SOSS complex subunit C n=1 Tax=Equus asinus TaxID=9793 RepID=A0A9L0IAH2_EQUAS
MTTEEGSEKCSVAGFEGGERGPRAKDLQQLLEAEKGFQNKNRVAILAELDKEKRKLLMQNQSSTNHPGASIALSRPSLNKDFRDHAEQQHIAAQQKAALQHAHAHSSGYFITQDSAFGNLILPVLPRLDPE